MAMRVTVRFASFSEHYSKHNVVVLHGVTDIFYGLDSGAKTIAFHSTLHNTSQTYHIAEIVVFNIAVEDAI